MLASTLGPGKALVQINADLNANQQQIDSVTYGKTGTPLSATAQQREADRQRRDHRRHLRQHGDADRGLRRNQRQRQLELLEQDQQHELRRQQDGVDIYDRARQGQPAEHLGARQQHGSGD